MSRLYRDMAKSYDQANDSFPTFRFEVLEWCDTRGEANRIEAEYIAHYRADHPLHGYNSRSGGGSHSIDYNKPVAIYCILNTVNDMYYIGLSNKPDVRWEKHRHEAKKHVRKASAVEEPIKVNLTGCANIAKNAPIMHDKDEVDADQHATGWHRSGPRRDQGKIEWSEGISPTAQMMTNTKGYRPQSP